MASPHSSPRHLRHSVIFSRSLQLRHSSTPTHLHTSHTLSHRAANSPSSHTHTATPPTHQSQTGGPPPVRMSEAKGQDPSEAKGPICVTGGSGFLGSWCVKMLLDKGYTVHATTRSAAKAAYLTELDGAEVQRREETEENRREDSTGSLRRAQGVCHCSLVHSHTLLSTHALLYPLRFPPAPDDLRWV